MGTKFKSHREDDFHFPPEENQDRIRNELDRVLASEEFTATAQQRKFLTYVVNEVLAGRGRRIKGYTVATEVFGRSEDFDASVDPIVSIQANKLRRALERYYLLDGKADPVVIDIPKGGYVPRFYQRQLPTEVLNAQSPAGNSKQREHTHREPWPVLKIEPFNNLTGDPEKDYIGTGISAELAIEISQFDNFRVCYANKDQEDTENRNSPKFILQGEICLENETIKLRVMLLDAKTHIRLWSDMCSSVNELPDLYSFKDRVVRIIASKICGEFGILPRIVRKEAQHRRPRELNTYEAISRYWEYEQIMSPESFQNAFEALTHAITVEPDCSQTLVSLAILYCNIHNLGIEGFESPSAKATYYAEKAALLSPNNQRVLTGLAYARMTAGELSSAVKEAHQALDLNPESLFMLDGIAWLLTLCGDWELGPQLAQKAIKLNPYHRDVAHDALWLNYMRQEEYERAYIEGCSRKRYSTLFWDSVIRSSTCGLMGKVEEGSRFVDSLLAIRSDFPANGRTLVHNFVKFDNIADKIFTGLQISGLAI